MIVIDDLNSFVKPSVPVVTSGTFDGVHIGHRKILERIIKTAKENNGHSFVVTYWPHPRFVINQQNNADLKLLSSFDEKCDLLQSVGIDYLIKIPFTRSFSELSSHEFIQHVLVDKIGTKKLVIGYDHRFGKNREGGFDYLQKNSAKYGFDIEEIPKQDIDHVGVSSTKIRNALKEGNIGTANSFLGRAYSLNGVVVRGNKFGRTIGFPTANIAQQESLKLIPRDGVYAVHVIVRNRILSGMLNIGVRPTLQGKSKTIEVHIFDFKEDIYGEKISIQFLSRVRDEMKFEDTEALMNQLHKDKAHVLKLLKN